MLYHLILLVAYLELLFAYIPMHLYCTVYSRQGTGVALCNRRNVLNEPWWVGGGLSTKALVTVTSNSVKEKLFLKPPAIHFDVYLAKAIHRGRALDSA